MRWAIAVLTAAAAMVAALNEVASLARFAAEKLHFPDGLAWTLPGMVTIATLAGALMWTVLHDVALRDAGRRLNIVCAVISALAVGLDHASGAEGWWVVPAGLVGALVPALATWLTHLLARMTADPVGVSAEHHTVAELVAEQVSLHTVPSNNAVPTPAAGIPMVKAVSPARTATQTASARVTDQSEEMLAQVRDLVAAGNGRPAIATTLGVKDHVARALMAKASQ